MRVLHFDTETTGLPVSGFPSTDPRQPNIVSISAVVDDEAGKMQSVFSTLIKPEGWKIDERPVGDDGNKTAFSVHGITNAVAMQYGMNMIDALDIFARLVRSVEIISAFNVFFDHKLVKIACARATPSDFGDSVRSLIATKSSVCTMEGAAMGLSGKKRISLKNAHFELFKREAQTDRYHGSLADTYHHRDIYYELKRRGWLLAPKPLTERVYDTPPPEAV